MGAMEELIEENCCNSISAMHKNKTAHYRVNVKLTLTWTWTQASLLSPALDKWLCVDHREGENAPLHFHYKLLFTEMQSDN